MLGAAIIKDMQLLLRDRGALASLFLLPIIFIVAFGSMFSSDGSKGEARALPVYHHPDDAHAAMLTLSVQMSGLFRPQIHDSADAVRELVAQEEALAGLIIPRDFDPQAGHPAELVIDEAASPAVRGPIEGALAGIITLAHYGDPRGGPIEVLKTRTPPGIEKPLDNASGFQISVPGNSVLFGFFLALTVALSFVEERRVGTWRRLLAAPVSRPVLLLAKLVPFLLIGLIQFVFLFGLGSLSFGMRVAGSIPALCALTFAVVLCATTLGLFIASFGGSEKQVGGIGSIVILVMGLLGGAMIPRPVMPETMQSLGLMVPHAWALDAYYDVLIREGIGLADIWRQLVALLGFSAAFGLIGALRFRFER